jgi:hypothetical protein
MQVVKPRPELSYLTFDLRISDAHRHTRDQRGVLDCA